MREFVCLEIKRASTSMVKLHFRYMANFLHTYVINSLSSEYSALI